MTHHYALYIWAAYGISLLILATSAVCVLKPYLAIRRRIQNLAKNSV